MSLSTENERDLAQFQARLNRDTLDEHLTKCRKEVADLQKELHELRAQIANTGIEYEPDKFTTLELILAYPEHYGAYEVCRKDGCREIDPHEHNEVRQWWHK